MDNKRTMEQYWLLMNNIAYWLVRNNKKFNTRQEILETTMDDLKFKKEMKING